MLDDPTQDVWTDRVRLGARRGSRRRRSRADRGPPRRWISQPGRRSMRSGRARHRRRIRSPVSRARSSTRSRNVGSAQWRSSSTHDEGSIRGECPEQATDRREQDPDGLRLGSQPDRRGDLGRHVLPVVIVRQQPMQPAPSKEAGRLDHRVSHGEERDTFTRRRTALDDDVGIRSDRGHELSRQARLPDSGLTQHGEFGSRSRCGPRAGMPIAVGSARPGGRTSVHRARGGCPARGRRSPGSASPWSLSGRRRTASRSPHPEGAAAPTGPMTISPSGAACCNRLAALTSGPATASRSAAPGPATTMSPASMPARDR